MKSFLLVVATFLVSCGGKANEITPDDEPQISPPLADKSGQDTTVKEPKGEPFRFDSIKKSERVRQSFSRIQESCSNAGGAYNEIRDRCICGDQQTFLQPYYKVSRDRFDNTIEKYVCRKLEILKPDAEGYESFLALLKESPEKFIEDLASIRGYNNRRVLEILVDPTTSFLELEKLAIFLDDNPIYYSIPAGFFRGPALSIEYTKNADIPLWVRSSQFHRFNDLEAPQVVTDIRQVASSPSQLSAILNPSYLGVAEKQNIPELIAIDEAISHVNKYFNMEENIQLVDSSILNQSGDCAISCIYTIDFKLNERTFSFFRRYNLSGVSQQKITYTLDDNAGFVTSDIGPSGLASNYRILRFSRDLDGSYLVSESFYGVHRELIHSKDTNYVDSLELEKANQLTRLSDINDHAIKVALKTEDLNFTDNWLSDYLLSGPFQSSNIELGGSLFGWYELPANEGFREIFEFFDSYITSLSRPSLHGQSVISNAKDGIDPGDIYFIPAISSSYNQNFWSLASVAKPQIVISSGGVNINALECNFVIPKRNDYLWIMAAGNLGIENPSYRCPQNISDNSQKIVVAAGHSGGLRFWSDYGEKYADIAADPTSKYDASTGTSFSAPTVANVAAKILLEHGRDTDPKLVRMAILLGAEVNPNKRLPLRTGGALNEDLALTAMNAIMGKKGPFRLIDEDRNILVSKGHPDREWVITTVLKNLGIYSRNEVMNQAKYLLENKI